MCPLNVDNFCIVYSVRPMSCAGYHSFEVQKCIEDTLHPEEELKIVQDPERIQLRALYSKALSAGLLALGLDDTELEIIPALRIALMDEEAGQKYMNGENVFAEADRKDIRQAQFQRLEGTNIKVRG